MIRQICVSEHSQIYVFRPPASGFRIGSEVSDPGLLMEHAVLSVLKQLSSR
jgi:hypothetical protein